MKPCRISTALLCIALSAHAQAQNAQDDFAYRADITLTAKDAPFHRAELPAEVLRGITRDDLADLRLYNAKGEPVPFAFANDAPVIVAAPTRVRLPFFAIGTMAQKRGGAGLLPGLDVELRTGTDGALISLHARVGAQLDTKDTLKPIMPPAYYVVDASALKSSINGLRLEWHAPNGGIAALHVEASDDLQTWRSLAASAPLTDLEQGGARLKNDLVEFAATKAKYLRLRLRGTSAAAWTLTQIEAQLAETTHAPREWRSAQATGLVVAPADATKPYETTFDLGGAFAVERIKLALPQVNTPVPIELLARNATDAPWRSVATTVAYRIKQGESELTSPSIAVPRTRARYWLVRAPANSGGFGGAPMLDADYAPRAIVFIARGGESTYTLAYGKRSRAGEKDMLQSAALNVATLMPGFKDGDEWQLPVAPVGAARTVNERAVQANFADRVAPKQIGLWALLVTAVGLLGFFAWRLIKT